LKDDPKTIPSGFTLLEVLLSLVMLSIVLIAVYRLHSQTIRMNEESRFLAMAPALAEMKLAEVEMAADFRPDREDGDFGETAPGYRWRVFIHKREFPEIGVKTEGLKRVDIQVSHPASGKRYRLRRYLFEGAGRRVDP